MNARLLLISLTLAWQLTAWGQETCAQKRNACNVDCSEAFANPARVKQCERDCYARAGCAAPTPTPTPPPPPRPWDVVASKDGLDGNGFLRNPVWNWATQPPGQLLDACDSCPCEDSFSDAVQGWRSSSTCTNQALHLNSRDLCSGEVIAEGGFGGSGIGYHMNWFPVEYEGPLAWEDHSDWTTDNEYSFNILRPDLALVTVGRENSGVHLEFNSTETVDDWDGTGTWWENFHHNIVDKLNSQDAIRNAMGTPFAIVIGMLGLDVAHKDHHSELHPVYAMFIRVPGPGTTTHLLTEDHWAFFVRNWGVEGFCGPGDEPLPDYRQIQVRLPGQALVASNIWVYAHGPGSIDECFSQSAVSSGGGLLTFNLPPASQRCGVVGDLTMRRVPVNTQAPLTGTAAAVPASSEGEDGDPVLRAKIAQLSPIARQELNQQLSDLMRVPRSGPIVRRMRLRARLLHVKRSQVTGKNLKAVADPALQAREEKMRQFTDAFLKAHGIQ